MTIPSAIAGGFIGTLVLTTIIREASELGWTRMDLALLLGTTVTVNRRKAKAIGYVFQFLLGIGFAVAYGEFFEIIGRSSGQHCALPGALHALLVASVLRH